MKIYFISGVNGVGKTTLMPALRAALPSERYAIVDFDSRGVPDGADHAWRKSEAFHWVEESRNLAREGKELVICGFVKPTDFDDLSDVRIIVLDADAKTIRARLASRYTKNGVFDPQQKVIGIPVAEFIERNVWYVDKMREESLESGLSIVDTNDKSPEMVAQEVARIITE